MLLMMLIVLYVASNKYLGTHPAWAWVKAFAEAGMVGALADWFAVVALFRHPFGIPIPHTAILPNKKKQIGENLANFVVENFLSAEQVAQKMKTFNIAGAAASWLCVEENAKRAARRIAHMIPDILAALGDPVIQEMIGRSIKAMLAKIPTAPSAAKLLHFMMTSGKDQKLLESGLTLFSSWVEENVDLIEERIAQELAKFPDFMGLKTMVVRGIAARVVTHLQSGMQGIIHDENHKVRAQFREKLRAYSEKLETSPELYEVIEKSKSELLASPAFSAALDTLGSSLHAAFLDDLAKDEQSRIYHHIHQAILSAGHALQQDASLQTRLNEWCSHAASQLLEKHATDLKALISDQVERWDAKELTEKLEQQVGNDLQFIRINGTLVGGLVGIILHAIYHH